MADLTQLSVREAMQRLHPPLPAGSVLPVLPADAHQIILEDDDEMMRIILQAATTAPPVARRAGGGKHALQSGRVVHMSWWYHRFTTRISQMATFLTRARQYLLASRLVGLNKPDAGVRPIAVGELFYRLACWCHRCA